VTTEGGITVDFAKGAQDLAPLQDAAYRLLSLATCHITEAGDCYRCNLTPRTVEDAGALQALKTKFLDFVTDENLRHRISRDTDGVRNVILALAFGSLARTRDAEQGI
jgi:His-Xaa-Ser system protein HxsD